MRLSHRSYSSGVFVLAAVTLGLTGCGPSLLLAPVGQGALNSVSKRMSGQTEKVVDAGLDQLLGPMPGNQLEEEAPAAPPDKKRRTKPAIQEPRAARAAGEEVPPRRTAMDPSPREEAAAESGEEIIVQPGDTLDSLVGMQAEKTVGYDDGNPATQASIRQMWRTLLRAENPRLPRDPREPLRAGAPIALPDYESVVLPRLEKILARAPGKVEAAPPQTTEVKTPTPLP